MKTQKTYKKQVSVKNITVCLNTYKNLSNIFTNLSKTAKNDRKILFFLKKCCIFVS